MRKLWALKDKVLGPHRKLVNDAVNLYSYKVDPFCLLIRYYKFIN